MLLKLVSLLVLVYIVKSYDPEFDEELSEQYILTKLAEIKATEKVYLAALKEQRKIVKEMKNEQNIFKQEL